MIAFHVGQRVVCIDDTHLPEEPGPYVVKNQIYTIQSIEAGYYTGLPVLCFEGLNNEPAQTESVDWDQGYNPDHFRPVVEKSTEAGMEILRKLLDPTQHKELVGE